MTLEQMIQQLIANGTLILESSDGSRKVAKEISTEVVNDRRLVVIK